MDECKIDIYLYREYGYAPLGRRVFGLVCGKKYKRLGIVAAKIGNKILSSLQYSGTMNSKFLEFWFSNQLLPLLKKGTVVVMDNASFHYKKGCVLLHRLLIASLSFCLLILPNGVLPKNFGLNLSDVCVTSYPFRLLLMMLCIPLLNCGNYNTRGPRKCKEKDKAPQI